MGDLGLMVYQTAVEVDVPTLEVGLQEGSLFMDCDASKQCLAISRVVLLTSTLSGAVEAQD